MGDITQLQQPDEVLRQIEERFRRLVEVMPVAVYVCDTSGILQNYNRRAVELWGREPKLRDPAECYCGSLRLYAPDGTLVPHQDSKMAEVLRTGIEARDLEVVIERPDRSRITVLVNIVLLRDGAGELIGAMNCFQDITNEVIEIETFDGVRKIMQTSAVPIRDSNERVTGAVVVNEDISARTNAERELNDSYNCSVMSAPSCWRSAIRAAASRTRRSSASGAGEGRSVWASPA